MAREVYETPSDVSAEQGEVIIDGPDGVAISMTPEAARETSTRLHRAAQEADEQRAAGR